MDTLIESTVVFHGPTGDLGRNSKNFLSCHPPFRDSSALQDSPKKNILCVNKSELMRRSSDIIFQGESIASKSRASLHHLIRIINFFLRVDHPIYIEESFLT